MARTPMMLLWSAVFAGYVALGATIQVLPPYVTGRFGTSATVAGWTVGIAFAATALSRPVAGWFADAGRSRVFVRLGGLLTALGGAGHLIAQSVGEILVARIVMGAGEAALFSAAIPWVLAGVPTAEKGKVAGWFGLSMWGGLAAGPVLASVILQTGSTRAVWVVVTLLGLLSFVLVSLVRAPESPSDLRSPFSLRGLLPRGSTAPGVVFGLSAYGYGAINAILVLDLHSRNLAAANYALAVFAAAFLVTRFLGSPLVTRWGGRAVWFVVIVIEVVGALFLAIPSLGTVGAVVGAALTGVGVSLMFPATVSVTLGRTGRTAPGTSVAVMTSFWDLGLLIAGPLSGLIADRSGYGAAFAVAAGVASFALLLGLVTKTSLPHGSVESRSGTALGREEERESV
ncbi:MULTISPECIES: MFS transporter [unclassified Mycobacteroides]|uniref:MFS transporter n=1 Tax=unclassified Mycobacteroides TaxID=2618759 RepID=UPI001396A44A|nr:MULTISPECIES: MFS transporter [unclassified Mycobacteroides]